MRLTVVGTAGCRAPRRAGPVLAELARRLAPRGLGVQVVVGDDALLRRLNREFRGRDRGTDVLSFLYEASPPRNGRGGDVPDAEMFVSLPRAVAQARERGHGTTEEMLVLALHGMLHLQGHDHHAPAQARRMGAAEAVHLDWVGRRWPRLRPRPLLRDIAPRRRSRAQATAARARQAPQREARR